MAHGLVTVWDLYKPSNQHVHTVTVGNEYSFFTEKRQNLEEKQ